MSDGIKQCPIDGYSDVWVKFKTSGYPFSLSRTLDKSKDASYSLSVILGYVIEWNIKDIDGNPVPLPPAGERAPELFDNIDETVATWVVKAFYENRAEIINSKNSLPLSPRAS